MPSRTRNLLFQRVDSSLFVQIYENNKRNTFSEEIVTKGRTFCTSDDSSSFPS